MTSSEFLEIRLATGLSQSEFGRLLGMKKQAISRIETGWRKPTVQQAAAAKLVQILNEKGELK